MATPSLAMIPSAYADSKVYSVLPNNGDGDFTFNRDSSATRVGQNGLIQEVGFFGSNKVSTIINDTTNLFPTFTDNGGGSYTCATTSTAYAGFEQPVSDDFTVSVGQVYRVSFDYTLNSGANDLQVFIGTGGVGSSYSGSPVLVSGTGTFTKDFTITTAATDAVFASQINSVSNFTISNISVKLIQGDQPRLNYDISNGVVQSCPSLLLEPASTNLITYSNDLSNSSWGKQNGGTGSVPIVTSNYSVSPDGTLNADRVVFNLNNGTANADVSQLAVTIGSVSSANYTNSVYIKSNTANNYALVITEPSGGYHTKTITNQWQRFNVSSSNATNVSFRIRLRGDESTSNYADVSIYGTQTEQQSYATSYIPTNGASQTRAAETCFGAGNAATFNSTEGVLYAEISALADDLTNRGIAISDGTANNRVTMFYTNVSNAIQVKVVVGGVNSLNNYIAISNISKYNKFALKYKQNDFSLFVNGIELIADSSGNTFANGTLTELAFDRGDGAEDFYGKVKDIRVYNEALTDAQLQTLTTL